MCLALLAALPGCSRLSELDPRPSFANLFGAHLEGRAPPPGLDQPWPKLSSVPPRPTPPDPATRARISADLEAAHGAKAEADAAMAAHREATARARAEAQAAVAAATQQASAEAAQRSEALNARLARQIEEAEARIAAARESAMGALRQVSTETAENLVAKLGARADRGAIGAAVDRALAARGQA